MHTLESISREISDLVQSHYYSEDFELISSIRAYYGKLSTEDRALMAEAVWNRVTHDGSIVDYLLCSVVPVPAAVPILTQRLDRESESNQVTRTLIMALRTYRSDDAYTAVERFIDSDQEMETLQALAEIDFVRTLPVMARLMRKDHFHAIVLHILYDRMKVVGIDGLINELQRSSVTASSSFRDLLEKSLRSKKEPYNPFSDPEVLRIISSMG